MSAIIEIEPTWLPQAPAWYRGRREQWQVAKANLERAYLDEQVTFEANAVLHESVPSPTFFVLGGQRYQDSETVCGCWHCHNTSPQAKAYSAARERLREVEIAVQQGGVG
jgi:hypothetical protein